MNLILKKSRWLVIPIFLVGCKRGVAPSGGAGSIHSAAVEHEKAIEEGYRSIDYADSIRKKYPSVSLIENFRHFSLTQKWKTIFFVNGRYEIVLEIPVSYDEKSLRPSALKSKSEMHIFEIAEVRVIDGGRYHVKYKGDQRRLNSSDIEDLAKSGWDFESIGLLNKGAPIPNFEGYIQSWVPKYPAQKEALSPRGDNP